MPRYSSQEIDEIVDTLRSARDRGKPAHILFGAGCSKAAGIPLASEIVAEIHNRYSGYCHRLAEADQQKYGACMKLLSPNERRDLLAPYLAKASINWAHIALAQFMNEKFIERALTVNFDNLLARACGLLSLYPAIYDFASAPTSDVSLIVSPAIVHLHGQGHGVALLNTEEETRAHSAKIAPVLRQSMDHPLIVIGYSGATDDVLRILREHYPGTEYLYWLSHSDDPDAAVRRVADDHGYFKCVGGVDADRFLIELAQNLRCWPPTICTNPIGHLLTELNPVSDYPTVPGNEVDILSTVRTRLAELEKSEQKREQTTREIERLLFEGHYEESVKVFEAIPAGLVNIDQRNLAVAALVLAGGNLYHEARKLTDDGPAEDLFRQAEAKFEAALRIKLNVHEALYNWGTALIERAKRASDAATAEDLFKQAEAKFEAALRIKPHDHEALNNWGTALIERAKRARDATTAEDLFKQAEAKYEAALQPKPDDHETLNNLGVTLIERAKRASDPVNAEELLKLAEAKFEVALRIKPRDRETLNNWGAALIDRAKRVNDVTTAVDLFKQAEAKYEAALQIRPDDHEVLYNWGVALIERAKRASSAATAEDLFKQAEAKFEAALRIKPNDHEALNNWGAALSERAKRAGDATTAEDLFKQAEAKFEAALRLKPDKHESLNNWGAALSERAKRAGDATTAENLFKQAEAKYEAALRIKPDDHEVLNNWGLALVEHAKRGISEQQSTDLLDAAETKLKMAEALGNTQTYNLACLYAVLGRVDECRTTLERTEKAGTLPTGDHMEGDVDLKSLRGLPWFGELIERLRKSQT
jgi:Tfp pilus assembly protein PilF